MTRITGPSDHSPAQLRAIAADLRAGDRPHGDRELLHGIATDLERLADAKEREVSVLPASEWLTPSERQALLRSDKETSDYAREAFRQKPAASPC